MDAIRAGWAKYHGRSRTGLNAILYNKPRSERLKKAGVLPGE